MCDLAARLTALGFDGDAQHAAVQAARLGAAQLMDKSSPSIPLLYIRCFIISFFFWGRMMMTMMMNI